MRTIFKYRERACGRSILLFRVGFLDQALAILWKYPDATPDNPHLRRELLRVGARLRPPGQEIDKSKHEREALTAEHHPSGTSAAA